MVRRVVVQNRPMADKEIAEGEAKVEGREEAAGPSPVVVAPSPVDKLGRCNGPHSVPDQSRLLGLAHSRCNGFYDQPGWRIEQ
jgi:hypothetical protein